MEIINVTRKKPITVYIVQTVCVMNDKKQEHRIVYGKCISFLLDLIHSVSV